jgi:hypothetical protein
MRIFRIGFPPPEDNGYGDRCLAATGLFREITAGRPKAIPRRAIRQMTPAMRIWISIPVVRHSYALESRETYNLLFPHIVIIRIRKEIGYNQSLTCLRRWIRLKNTTGYGDGCLAATGLFRETTAGRPKAIPRRAIRQMTPAMRIWISIPVA